MKRFASLLLTAGMAVSCATTSRQINPADLPACCTTNIAPATAYTDRSLYQLESIWTNDLGQPFQLGAWRGRPQVVAMFFARCTFACPIIVQDLQRIEAALPQAVRSQVRFALVTIDTERDTADVLHAYRAERKLATDGWTLLSGSPAGTLELAALLGVNFKREVTGQYAHSNLITVLDAEGEIIHQVTGLNQPLGDTVSRITAAVNP